MQNFGPKMQFFGPKPPFFRVERTRLNGIISPPYPEATQDNFGFPVGGRLAARRAVSWPRLPKVALSGPKVVPFGPKVVLFGPKVVLFGPKSAVFWPEINFCGQPQKTLPEAQRTQGIESTT